MDRPTYLTDEHLEYLDTLRESGVTNMYGAQPYLRDEYPKLNRNEATKVLLYWMKTFSERHPSE